MNSVLKKVLAAGASLYLTAYALLSGYALIDYWKNGREIKENAPNHLIVREYSADINGRKKNFALVGENHLYNKKEMHNAVELIKSYDNVALEGSLDSRGRGLDRKITALASAMPRYFYISGAGRSALNSVIISGLYKKPFKEKVFPLEAKDPLDNLNKTQKIGLFFETLGYLMTAPLEYFKGKSEKDISLEDYEKSAESERKALGDNYLNCGEREGKMADNIASIIKANNRGSLVCFVGAYHLNKIDSILKSKLKLKRVICEKE